MRRRVLAVLAVVLALVAPVAAELGYQIVAANDVSQTVTLNSPELVVINDGTDEIYVRVFYGSETAAAATTANAQIQADESMSFRKDFGIKAVSIVCATGETATVRLFW